MEKHLCTFVNYQQDDLPRKLAIAKFAANNSKSASTKLFPFFITKSLHLCMSFDRIELFNTSICNRIFN